MQQGVEVVVVVVRRGAFALGEDGCVSDSSRRKPLRQSQKA